MESCNEKIANLRYAGGCIMNSENTPQSREQIEASLTALILGELPAEQAFNLGRMLEKDAELAKLYERLKQTIGLVRETAATGANEEQATPLKMSDERRQKLLAHFKTVKPAQFGAPKRRHQLTWLEVAAVVAILAVLAALLL